MVVLTQSMYSWVPQHLSWSKFYFFVLHSSVSVCLRKIFMLQQNLKAMQLRWIFVTILPPSVERPRSVWPPHTSPDHSSSYLTSSNNIWHQEGKILCYPTNMKLDEFVVHTTFHVRVHQSSHLTMIMMMQLLWICTKIRNRCGTNMLQIYATMEERQQAKHLLEDCSGCQVMSVQAINSSVRSVIETHRWPFVCQWQTRQPLNLSNIRWQ